MLSTKALFVIFCLHLALGFHISSDPNIEGSHSSPLQAEYNVSLSKDYAILGVASYCDKKCLENWSCKITSNYLPHDQVKEVTHLMGTVTRAGGFVAFDATKNQIIVSLRGSANIENWVSDFTFDNVAYSKCKDCKVHLGFLEDYNSIQSKMMSSVEALLNKYPTAGVVAVGHSMGAALSVIVGVELKLKFGVQVQIHNLGSPRVGNAEFAQFVQNKVDRVFRLVHHRDLIPHLPPTDFGFRHSAFEVFWDKQFGNYTVCSSSGEDSQCSNQYFPEYSFGDHGFYFWDLGKILKC